MHLDQVDVVSSGEVETIENDVLVQVDHPHSGLGDVLLQDCFCQTRLHLGFNKIIIFTRDIILGTSSKYRRLSCWWPLGSGSFEL